MKAKKTKETIAPQTPHFHLINWVLIALGVITIGLGFLFLSQGSETLAPILLVAGYCVILPLALLVRPKPKEIKEKENV